MEDPILYTSLSLIILLIALKLLLQVKKGQKNIPPSPRAVPVIGHLHLLKPPLNRTFHSLSQKYRPGFSLWFGYSHVVVVSSPSAVEECFTKNDVILANQHPLIMGKHIGYNHTTIVGSPYGDHWRNLRRIGTLEILSSARLNNFLATRRDEVRRLLLRISQNSLRDSGNFELKSMFHDLTLNIIMRMVAGKRFHGDDVADEDEGNKFKVLTKEIFENAAAGNPANFLPILNWLPEGFEKRIKRLAKRTDTFLQSLIDEHRNRKESENTMIDHLLSLQESQPEYYTEQIIKGFVLILLLAATDTSAVTLEWAIPIFQNIISETLRLYPAAPLLVPHYSSDGCTIAGYDVPRGSILFVNAWSIHRDPKLWDDAESFRPERFENGESEIYKLMPFGLGRRSCPGIGLAQRIIGLTLGSLIQCFDWERIREEEIDMVEGKGLTMPKAVPLEAICKARPMLSELLSETVHHN